VTAAAYVDTSALAKWYLNEPRSDDFAAWITGQRAVAVSRLTVVEFRCLLARRRRAREIAARMERRIVAAFDDDVRQGFVDVHPLYDRHAIAAMEIMTSLPRHPLRTLDALHLAIARETGAPALATADRIMAAAARSLKMEVVRFD
jgi:predicted nucleic acid-binding protein